MSNQYENSTRGACEIGCQFSPAADSIVKPRPVRGVCRAIWPEKTDAHVAVVCGCSVRTAARYLSDEIDAPAVLIVAIGAALTSRR